MSDMLIMNLQMIAAMAVYVIATVLLWRVWRSKEKHSLLQKLAIGLFYGLCSVISSHIGIDYGTMVLNVRDIGPLAAGLFFSPVSGIVSGLIGGIERFIIGEYFGIGSFTRVACGISTVLAGLMAAAVNKLVFRGRRPSSGNCMLIGAEMEVFHMYAVFITNRDNMLAASSVVQTCAVPMIFYTGLGLALCSVMISRISGTRWKNYMNERRRNIPMDLRFQVRLMALILILFLVSSLMNYSLQTRTAEENAGRDLEVQLDRYQSDFLKDHDLEELKEELDDDNRMTRASYLLVDADRMLQYTMIETEEPSIPANPEDVALMIEHADGGLFHTVFRPFGKSRYLCVASQLDGSYYIMGGISDYFVQIERQSNVLETLFLEILIFTILYQAIGVLVNRLVARNLDRVNESLTKITAGDLNEEVAVWESSEFTKLSEDINKTVTALRGFIDAAEKRMEEELQLAASIQESALPRNFHLPYKEIELYASMTPAKQVGGDFYDFFFVGIGKLALVMADVSGKGIPAAMFMMRAKTAIKNYARDGMGPAEILENVNNFLCDGNDTHMFVTVWLGILDLQTGQMRCANAGHEYPVVKRAGGSYSVMEDRHGFVLGGFEDIPMQEYGITMNPGDRLFVYTDGIPEAMNEAREQYGLERLTERLNSLKDKPQEEVLGSVLEDIREFAGKAEQFDDITMLGVTYIGSQPEG